MLVKLTAGQSLLLSRLLVMKNVKLNKPQMKGNKNVLEIDLADTTYLQINPSQTFVFILLSS